jgi:chromosome segregation ATPase
MSKDLKDLINSVDNANKAHSDLETMIRLLKEEVQRLKFTVSEQKKIIQSQNAKLSNVEDNNIPEDIKVLKDLVVTQRQELIKKEKDIEILQNTLGDISTELETSQTFEEENEELIYANKTIVQLTEENELYRQNKENLINRINELENILDAKSQEITDENKELVDAKKKILQLSEENGIKQIAIEKLKAELEELNETESEKREISRELEESNKLIDQLTYDNDQYQEKVNYLQQRLEEVGQDIKKAGLEDLKSKISQLETENREYRSIINSNIKVIESLKENNINLKSELERDVNLEPIVDEDILKSISEKEKEIETLNLKLQNFENSNKQLSDLIVELKLKEKNDKDQLVGLPSPSLFFKMFLKLSEVSRNQIIKHLIDNLQSENRDTKAYSIKVLSIIKGQRIFDALSNLLNDNDWIIKLYLIKALVKFENPEVIDILKHLQRDSDIDVREAATEMLLKFNC